VAVDARTTVGAKPYSGEMSKVDAMQAMREARYAAQAAGPPAASAVRPVVAARAKVGPRAPGNSAIELAEVAAGTGPEAAEEPEALCGHRSMNGRNCSRSAGHSEKNHRYN